jgi:hypothetical protein
MARNRNRGRKRFREAIATILGPCREPASINLCVALARRSITLWVLAIILTAFHVDSHAQEPSSSVQGFVVDTSGTALENVEIVIGQRQTRTDARGFFRVDDVPTGRHLISLRLVGYRPVHTELAVLTTGVTEVTFHLVPAVPQLPSIVVEATRTGIYGAVHDSAYRPIAGARVQVLGRGGGSISTDSAGRFAFPAANRGVYLVRITRAGYRERLLTVELEPGKGQEFFVRLMQGRHQESRMTTVALQDLQRRLVWGLRREFLTAQDLRRYRRLGLCDIARVKAELGSRRNATTTVIVNGVTVYRSFPVTSLCLWNADEVELVEFGRDVCRDVTGSIALLLGGWCSPGRRGRSQSGGTGYIVIWERR